MRLVAALGGNALLRRGQALEASTQAANAKVAATAVARLAEHHDVVVTHGNGPQVGLLALQNVAFGDLAPYPFDVLDAETEGMVGYLLEQELANQLPQREVVTLLTRVEVDPHDPAFAAPTKPVGPLHTAEEAARIADGRGWAMARDREGYRRVVASPRPLRILELHAIRLLVEHGVVVVCAGGGGIPVATTEPFGAHGIEAVIDKDRSSALLATGLGADALLLLTDVDAVVDGWGTGHARRIRRVGIETIERFELDAGSMGPKVEAACSFARGGGLAVIGALDDAAALLAGATGTTIVPGDAPVEHW